MKMRDLLLVIIVLISSSVEAMCQDLTAFEVVDNESVGLTIAPFGKAGVAIADIDGNGWQDIFCIRWSGENHSRIYTNTEGFFTDITEQSPLQQIEEGGEETETRTCMWVDYDNDGDKDLSIGTNKAIHLLRNDNNVFTEVSDEVGFVGQKPGGFIVDWFYSLAGWADYDLDGDLDCAVSQDNNPNLYLFRNDGDHFTNAATEAGLDNCVIAGETRVSWCDIDLDGDPDLLGRHTFLFNHNGVFHDVTDSIGLKTQFWTTHREFFDYDNDCDLDFFKVPSTTTDDGAIELWENRDGFYFDVSQEAGFINVKDRYRSLSPGDCDNDGDLDIFVQVNIDQSSDLLFVNDDLGEGTRAFAEVSEFIGITKTGDLKGGGFFDYNNDGFLDIYIPSAEFNHVLYRNLGGNDANWIGFILKGTTSNRDVVGSLVTLYTGDKKQIRYTTCGNDFVRQDNPWVHFGIGYASEIDSVVIRWPLGDKQVLKDIAINQYHKIKEGEVSAVKIHNGMSTGPDAFQLKQNYPNPFNPDTRIEYQLSSAGHVSLFVCDMTGREVVQLVNCKKAAGSYTAQWDGRDTNGRLVPSGVYLYQLKIGNASESRKMVIMQ
ncbi:VCBS repeat-containing protein [candidate division KSB1 bacterium]|nr:VCBS repeat-containing protein [candidate division KSB1 bacterium]